MANKPRPRVEFRLDEEIYAILQRRVEEFKKQGAKVTVDTYARSLLLAALDQAEQVAAADRFAIEGHAAKRRIGVFLGKLIEDNMTELVAAASGEEG